MLSQKKARRPSRPRTRESPRKYSRSPSNTGTGYNKQLLPGDHRNPPRLPSLAPSSYGGGCRFSPHSVMGTGRAQLRTLPVRRRLPREPPDPHPAAPTASTPPAHPGPLSPPSPATHRRLAGRCPRVGRPVPAGRAAALQLPLAVQGPEPHVGQEHQGGQRQPHRLQQPLLLPPHRSGCRERAEQRDGDEEPAVRRERAPAAPAALPKRNFRPRSAAAPGGNSGTSAPLAGGRGHGDPAHRPGRPRPRSPLMTFR